MVRDPKEEETPAWRAGTNEVDSLLVIQFDPTWFDSLSWLWCHSHTGASWENLRQVVILEHEAKRKWAVLIQYDDGLRLGLELKIPWLRRVMAGGIWIIHRHVMSVSYSSSPVHQNSSSQSSFNQCVYVHTNIPLLFRTWRVFGICYRSRKQHVGCAEIIRALGPSFGHAYSAFGRCVFFGQFMTHGFLLV